jgi:hypothetical protein
MTFEQFKATLKNEQPAAGIPASLTALWYAGKGDWEQAHNIAQDIPTREGSWVHAYLHRVEGDDSNASYWYNRAGKKMSALSLEAEWEEIAGVLLGNR